MTLHDRTNFFAMAARLMREILIDHAPRRQAARDGGAALWIGLDDALPAVQPAVVAILDLDRAVEDFLVGRTSVPRLKLRFFAGLSIGEAAEALDISTATVELSAGPA